MKKIHFIYHYVSLFFLLTGGFILFFLTNGYPGQQFIIAVFVSALYVLWGIIHHYIKGDLHMRLVIEYSLIALLAIVLIRGAIIR